MIGGGDAASRLCSNVLGCIAGCECLGGIHRAIGKFARTATTEIRLQISASRGVGVIFALLQSPLLLGRINQSEIGDASIRLGGNAGAHKVWNRDGGQQADNRDNNHNFHEGEPACIVHLSFHVLTFFLLCDATWTKQETGLYDYELVHFVVSCGSHSQVRERSMTNAKIKSKMIMELSISAVARRPSRAFYNPIRVKSGHDLPI